MINLPGPPDEIAQAQLSAIVDSSDDVIISKTLDGVITTWNAAAERLFGYTADEAIGRNITLIIPEERLDEEREVLRLIRLGERVDHFETIRRARDGRLRNISLTVSPIKDSHGVIVGASKIARDITDRRLAERGLNSAMKRIELLYLLAAAMVRARTVADVGQAAVDAIMAVGADRAGVLAFDEAGHMRFLAWRNLSDHYRETVEGHSLWPRDADNPLPIIVENASRDPGLVELREVLAAEGIASLAFIPLLSHGRLLGKFMIYYDALHTFPEEELRLAEAIAQHVALGLDRVLAEIAIKDLLVRERAARAEAVAANRGKDQFLAIVSHELRTPLNAILGWAQMLRGSQLDERQNAHAIQVIERNARLQQQLIGDLLDVSRIVAGKMEIEREPVDLVLVARQAADSLAAEIRAKKLEFVVDLDPAAGEVLGDARRLEQVISNLLSNAVKFTPQGGRIEVRLARHEATARLSVTNTGDGIDPDVLPRIFDPFQQAESNEARRHGGLGLGLAIVRQLIVLHGGTIDARNEEPGLGATFTVDLPVLAVRLRGTVNGLASPQAPVPPALRGGRILIVDDQPDAGELLAFVLARSGAEVRVAESGAEALEALATQEFDVLVSDVAMPDMDGYQLIRQVRQQPGSRQIRAVAVTAFMGQEVRARAQTAGFNACATKPIDAGELVELLTTLL